MKTTLSHTGIISVLMLAAFSSFAAPNHPNNTSVIYGLSNAKYIDAASQKQYYVQAGTFKHKKNAYNLKQKLINKHHQPVTVKPKGNYYVVVIGPMSAADARALNGSKPARASRRHTKPAQPVAATAVSTGKYRSVSKVSVKDKDGLDPKARNHFEIIGALGVASLKAGDSYLGVTSSETDKLVQTNRNRWNTFATQLGGGYVYYFHNYNPVSDRAQWLTAIEPQINWYYLGQSSINGDVWRFGSPEFNQMTYSMPIESNRLMLDGALTVLSRKHASLYVKGGIGNAWNRVGYSNSDGDGIPCSNEFLNLNFDTSSSFAWELGAGLSYAINHRASFSLEYLYADLGNAKTSGAGYTGSITTPVIVPAKFRLTSQSVLLGLHVAI